MARTNIRLVEAHNTLLSICDGIDIGACLPSENVLAEELGVSRTVVRSALNRLDQRSIIVRDGRQKVIQRRSTPDDTMEGPPVLLGIEELEKRFLDWVLRMDVPQGTVLNVAQLAKEFEVTTHTLQEFLSSLSRFGIVTRRPRGGWKLEGFTINFALELSDFRTVLELNAVSHLVKLPDTHPIWAKLDTLEADHLALLERIDEDYHDFSQLDEAFHTAINSVVTNRFVTEFQKIISLVFHYHFQWNKSDERIRNECAIQEHLVYIEALRGRDSAQAEAAARSHLATSKLTLVNSLKAHARDA
ncbi:GntR family transcriptional regulator [Gymnodinialimonas sp. 2305UL16-5]|uniref:GntR family transcriptional regulator n=1 Tax=Gymnodinialimonas mytili TaxID=3126503 RepID=UPI0030B72081